ncbi:5-(carboxyamino)imidazole ribonucleotide synthase [Paenibacillus thermotolerans]|uniref:5-(carboxyamino)imidazole ribonucleotide synthase n=1 Tax=Paenibacillus thermotolerans TaxID=3027807 RepID=UPI0023687542|nr:MULTISPECIES: 5-(carboxyamino)imidazole ribonucleotide synthase [unclassified Paenibacillus]
MENHNTPITTQVAEAEKTNIKPILPGATIGILGGGQLGRMIALAGRNMGYRFAVLDPTPDSPCGQAADRQITAGYADEAAARELASLSDVITYEFENVNAGVAAVLERESFVPQGSALLRTTQHRLREKQAIEAAGAIVAPYREVLDLPDLRRSIAELGLPCVLKTSTGGYDGKGQRVIRRAEEAADAFAALGGGGVELILEGFVDFQMEISVVAARSVDGTVSAFPPAENVHVNGILHTSAVPARIGEELAREACALAAKIAESLNVAGLIAVEMFVGKDGTLYVNELAPRPHNSGHYTMDACTVSQFEQHIRAICGLPLTEPRLLTPVVMVNVLGEHVEPLLRWLESGGERRLPEGVTAKLHLYGKAEAKPGRKMGHVNLLTNDIEKALRWVETCGIWRES